MKKFILIKALLSLVVLTGCKREASAIKVNNNFVEKSKTSKLEPKELIVDQRVRAMTLLSYPIQQDIKGWDFTISEETQASWDLFIQSLNFGNKIKTKFEKTNNLSKNITDIVMVV